MRAPKYLAVVLLVLLFSDAPGDSRPNIILIFSDDHGFADLGSQGVLKDLKTPNLDRLAVGGARMLNGYVSAPQCVPSRAGLLTGRYQNRFGVESNGLPLNGFNQELTIAERLKRVGYATGMTGKWHLGPPQEIVSHGFERVFYKNSNRPGWANFDLEGNNVTPGRDNSGLYHLDANSEAACAFIRKHKDQPFFFYCAYRAPHVPLDAPEKYLSRFPGKMPRRRRQALAMISAMDDGVGKMIATLQECKLEERTLIFFIGDNGAPLKIHKEDAPGGGPGWDGSLNDPLNGEKGMLSEGGIRVPFLVYWKGKIKHQEYKHPTSSLDVAATACALAKVDVAPDRLDGTNLIPYLADGKTEAPHRMLFWRWISQSAARSGRWKYLRGGEREYLFDLDEDKEEKRNRIKDFPEVAAKLKKELETWSQDLKPAGLETREMSVVWNRYFDYYLDGKPAPPLARANPKRTQGSADRYNGWIARNSRMRIDGGVMTIIPKGKKRPFIAKARLNANGPVKVIVTLKNERAGALSVSWRSHGQSDFVKDQVVEKKIEATNEYRSVAIEIPGDQKVIHIRLILPQGSSSVKTVNIQGS